nr:MAG TPA: hypothetical protein [Caudoviricetes sp.]
MLVPDRRTPKLRVLSHCLRAPQYARAEAWTLRVRTALPSTRFARKPPLPRIAVGRASPVSEPHPPPNNPSEARISPRSDFTAKRFHPRVSADFTPIYLIDISTA